MAIDSSSGTSPRSSLVTIASSSFRATSKLRLATSGKGSATIRSSGLHEPAYMRRRRIRQSLQIVAPLQERHHPAVCPSVGDVLQLAGRPVEILRIQVDLGQRVAAVRVEAGGDEDQVGAEFFDRRQDALLESLLEARGAVAGRQRRVEDVAGAGFRQPAGAREE